MLDVILADAKDDPPSDLLAQLLNLIIVSHDETAAAKALERVAKPASDRYAAWQMATIAALLDALERHGGGLKELHSEAAPASRDALAKLGGLSAYARSTVESATASESDRLLAIRLLGREAVSQREDAVRLGGVLRPQFSAPLQQAALDRLEQIDHPQVGRTLVSGWRNYGPSLRTDALNALLSRPACTGELLAAIQTGTIAAAEVSPAQQQRLMRHSEQAIRLQAEKLFAARN